MRQGVCVPAPPEPAMSPSPSVPRSTPRTAGDLGAVALEYALIILLLAAVGLGATALLTRPDGNRPAPSESEKPASGGPGTTGPPTTETTTTTEPTTTTSTTTTTTTTAKRPPTTARPSRTTARRRT
jgi:hypothetical protein